MIHITIDAEFGDRPHRAENAQIYRVLDVLNEVDVRATFFVQGRWAEAFPDSVLAIDGCGHKIGLHTMYHAPLPLLTPAGVREDLEMNAAVIERIVGPAINLHGAKLRLPFGRVDHTTKETLDRIGVQIMPWTVDARDWNPKTNSIAAADKIASARPGDTVLLHSWPDVTPWSLQLGVNALKDSGFEVGP